MHCGADTIQIKCKLICINYGFTSACSDLKFLFPVSNRLYRLAIPVA